MKTNQYVKNQVKAKTETKTGYTKQQEKTIKKVVITLGAILATSTVVNIVNTVLLVVIIHSGLGGM